VDQAIEFILAKELNRLKAVPPFDAIPQARLGELLARSRIVFFRRGSAIFHPDIAMPTPCFWIVREGRVRVAEADETEVATATDAFMEVGGLFPIESLLDRGRGWLIYAADEDCYLWTVEGDDRSPWLLESAVSRWAALALHDSQLRLRKAMAELGRARQHSDQALAMPARSVGATEVVYVTGVESIGDVAALMARRQVGSVLVGSPGSVQGIVTHSDLVNRGIGAGTPYDAPVSEIMTRAPRMIEDTASVLEAGIEMVQGRFRHLLLRGAEGKVVGLVSETDIHRAQQYGVTHVFRPIDEASSVAELVDVAQRLREFGERVFRQGMEVGQVMRLVSSMNDRITRRMLDVLGSGKAFGTPYCWLAFGSEARQEQGFVTDQDNGIVFVPPASGSLDGIRAEFLGFAREVNEALDACGFALCKGNIMASNPQWCLSLEEWKEQFSSWIRATTPTALLNATIFFDLRPVHGDAGVAETLLDHLLGQSRGNTIFLLHMAVNATAVAPPLGRISRFTTEGGEKRGTIDLKTQGSRLFVDAARIYALAHGVRSANTVERLRVVGQRTKRSLSVIEGDLAAFRIVQRIRLQRQLDSLHDGGEANRINPYTLDELQQRILRESLRQAVSVQERLKLDFCP
jgi:CBS domain-containing protein